MLSSCTTLMTSHTIVSYLAFSKSFNFYAIYEREPYGHNTMGGIEYDDGGCVRRQKRTKSHIDTANQWAMEMPTD